LRILLVSDEPVTSLWDVYTPEKGVGVELILAAGDLKQSYLDFLSTMIGVPLVYVPGNHDRDFVNNPPLGCICADDDVVRICNLRIGGLGGCMGMNPNEQFEYSEKQMSSRVKKLSSKVKKAKGIDVFLTHAPAQGAGDGEDVFHRGFACFNDFIALHKPQYHVFGHQHVRYGRQIDTIIQSGATTHINACGHQFIDIPV
jgi:Icc-related predicted phosphoesterase